MARFTPNAFPLVCVSNFTPSSSGSLFFKGTASPLAVPPSCLSQFKPINQGALLRVNLYQLGPQGHKVIEEKSERCKQLPELGDLFSEGRSVEKTQLEAFVCLFVCSFSLNVGWILPVMQDDDNVCIYKLSAFP